jgi:NAD(P)-dependent dehydrogenase (short-subunit alcohol dehydrogenase family)
MHRDIMHAIDLSGKAALVTGGTRNIGRAIAQQLAQAGADVALFYRIDEAAAIRARQEIRASTGRRVEVYRADVGDEAAVEAGLERALRTRGRPFEAPGWPSGRETASPRRQRPPDPCRARRGVEVSMNEGTKAGGSRCRAA